ncbi:hypothetical protein HMPREF1315_1088 [Bifidobacterium longum subsp. longum 2-2B]|uniref:Transposase n=1 Tax=Bifidobacterium longum subsp. longum 2-2B TaxID=1161745 RepID=A0AAV3FK14_BIFLL|nr:hypothetical protein HMPREF1315_1088 [Bifidobacterium longum subsp. longum 2-2B]
MLLTPLKAKPDEPVPPMPWRGKRSRGGGYAALMPTIDESSARRTRCAAGSGRSAPTWPCRPRGCRSGEA